MELDGIKWDYAELCRVAKQCGSPKKFIEYLIELGRQKGLAEGIEEGKVEGKKEVLIISMSIIILVVSVFGAYTAMQWLKKDGKNIRIKQEKCKETTEEVDVILKELEQEPKTGDASLEAIE